MIKFYDRDKCYYRFLRKKSLEKWIETHEEIQHIGDTLLSLYEEDCYYCFWACMYYGELQVHGTTTKEEWVRKELTEILVGLRQRSE